MISHTGDQTSDHRIQSWNSTTEPHCTRVRPNQPVMVNAWPILNDVSCSHIHTYIEDTVTSRVMSSQVGETYLSLHDHNFKGKEINIHFFLNRGIILLIDLPWQKNPISTALKCSCMLHAVLAGVYHYGKTIYKIISNSPGLFQTIW